MKTLLMVPKLTSYISLYNEPLFSGQLYADADTKIYYISLDYVLEIVGRIIVAVGKGHHYKQRN